MQDPDKHRRYFQIAGITACVRSDLDFDAIGINPELVDFFLGQKSTLAVVALQ